MSPFAPPKHNTVALRSDRLDFRHPPVDFAGQVAVRAERVVDHLALDAAGFHLAAAGDGALLQDLVEEAGVRRRCGWHRGKTAGMDDPAADDVDGMQEG